MVIELRALNDLGCALQARGLRVWRHTRMSGSWCDRVGCGSIGARRHERLPDLPVLLPKVVIRAQK
jgi:hypothetical protein